MSYPYDMILKFTGFAPLGSERNPLEHLNSFTPSRTNLGEDPGSLALLNLAFRTKPVRDLDRMSIRAILTLFYNLWPQMSTDLEFDHVIVRAT